MNRRAFLTNSTAALAAGLLAPTLFAQESTPPPAGVPKAPPKPPALPADKVKSVVGKSHSSLDDVRALVEETPLLVNAVWDWGGGDFETPLQAAAHTGRRPIAEFLLSKNARFDLYAAAMLGELDQVKALLAADPVRLAAVPGPHGFTVYHCAKQGGDQAKSVVDWLASVGVPTTKMIPLPYIWPAGTKPE